MTCQHCERQTCLPEGYAPLCSRHYIAAINSAVRDAEVRMMALLRGQASR